MKTATDSVLKKVFKNENEIQKVMGENYNHTMCHRMKNKDTTGTCFPTNGLWKPEVLYKTTNEVIKPTAYQDPYQDETHHYKKSFEKAYGEEMAKAQNIIKQRNKNETEKREGKSNS
jgi:hypothetical protein